MDTENLIELLHVKLPRNPFYFKHLRAYKA